MKYYIKTFGCQMNVHESEKLAGMLESLGYISTDSYTDADVIVFNTCCIRDGVEQKIMGNIGALKKLKKVNPNAYSRDIIRERIKRGGVTTSIKTKTTSNIKGDTLSITTYFIFWVDIFEIFYKKALIIIQNVL